MSAAILAVAAATTAAIVVRPFRWPEAVWAVGGAALLLALGQIAPHEALATVLAGGEVYLFLAGMMLLAEAARVAGVFDWIATAAVAHARGSPRRLFALVYAAGVVVTALLSNDATAVVLTPAVLAVTRRAGVDPMPHLFACAMVANAASFVLPISNPANLVLYGDALPPLGAWLAIFALPAAAAIGVTFVALRRAEAAGLTGTCPTTIEAAPLARDGRIALAGIAIAAIVLLAASALDRPLGLPTALAGAGTAALVTLAGRRPARTLVRAVAWDVLALVAGLFVIVGALERTGVIAALARAIAAAAHDPAGPAALLPGVVLAFAANLVNNLPAGLLAATAAAAAGAKGLAIDGLLIGVDLGPNLSITGSLATILWLSAIRREGLDVGFGRFLRTGAIVMPPALVAALAVRWAIA